MTVESRASKDFPFLLPFLREDGFLGRRVGKESVVPSKKARQGWLVLSAVESCLFFAIWGCWGPDFTGAGLPGPPPLQLTFFPSRIWRMVLEQSLGTRRAQEAYLPAQPSGGHLVRVGWTQGLWLS